MTYLVILGVYFVILTLIDVLSRKSFGTPTLALAAGSILAEFWTDSLTPLVASFGLAIVHPPLASIVAVVLTLLPALLVMIRAPKAKGMAKRIIGGVVFGASAVGLTYAAYERAVVLDEASKGAAQQLAGALPILLTVCLVLAVLEILFRKKKAKIPEELNKHHGK